MPHLPRSITRPALRAVMHALLLAGTLGATAAAAPRILIFGEQHDQTDHQRQVADAVRELAREQQLAALVIEMAEQGRSTAGLPPAADETQVRDRLAWAHWDWSPYAGVVMNAVRAGVPVIGGNLPRQRLREAMDDTSLDARVGFAAREAIATAVREGHCGLLPATQEPGMVRIQIARDRSLAQALAEAARSAAPGQRVVLLTGAQHASRDRGVPLHLDAAGLPADAGVQVTIFGSGALGLSADDIRPAELTPRPDPCEGLRRQLEGQRAASSPA